MTAALGNRDSVEALVGSSPSIENSQFPWAEASEARWRGVTRPSVTPNGAAPRWLLLAPHLPQTAAPPTQAGKWQDGQLDANEASIFPTCYNTQLPPSSSTLYCNVFGIWWVNVLVLVQSMYCCVQRLTGGGVYWLVYPSTAQRRQCFVPRWIWYLSYVHIDIHSITKAGGGSQRRTSTPYLWVFNGYDDVIST